MVPPPLPPHTLTYYIPTSPLQVRWYSFQFVMDELVEELEEAYVPERLHRAGPAAAPHPLDLQICWSTVASPHYSLSTPSSRYITSADPM